MDENTKMVATSATQDLVRKGDPCDAHLKTCPSCGFIFKGTYEDEMVCPMCHTDRPKCQRTVCREARAAGYNLCYAHWKMQHPELQHIVDITESHRIPFIVSTVEQFGRNNAPDLSSEIIQLREMIQKAYEEDSILKPAEYARLVNSLATAAETNKRIQEKNKNITDAVQKIVEETRQEDAIYYMAYMLLLVLSQFGWDSDEAKFIRGRIMYINVAWYKQLIKAAEDLRDEISELSPDKVDEV